MFIKARIPLPLIIKEYKIDDIVMALGLAIEDKQLSIEISQQGESKCEAAQVVCSILRDLNGYKIKSSKGEYCEECKKALRILSYIVKDIVINKSLNITRALSNAGIGKEDSPILCIISNGGIIFSITRNPLNPVCFRIPASDYYLVSSNRGEKQTFLDDNIFSMIERLWNNREMQLEIDSIMLKAIVAWREKDKQYIVVREKPPISSNLRVFKISSWGLDIDITP